MTVMENKNMEIIKVLMAAKAVSRRGRAEGWGISVGQMALTVNSRMSKSCEGILKALQYRANLNQVFFF